MSLPNSDPSLISNPAPIFQDNSFVRGDHLRANNQAIWANLVYILNGQLTEPLSASTFTAAGLATLQAKAVIEAALKMTTANIEGAVILTDADGSFKIMSNVHEIAGVVYLGFTGATSTQNALRIRMEGATGVLYIEYFTGTANTVINDTAWSLLLRLSTTNPATKAGDITGGLAFQSTVLPPTVRSGIYEAGGIGWFKNADVNLTMSNAILGASTTLADHAYSWMWATIKISDGSLGILPCVDGPAINSGISCSAAQISTGTLTVSCAGTLPAVGTVAVLLGANVPTIGKVTASGATSGIGGVPGFQLKTSSVGTVTGTLTYTNYNRIYTAHGAIGAVTVDTDIEKFTPSASIVAGTSGFCTALQGYYLDANGIPTTVAASAVYRILGPWYVHTGPLVEYVLSYKSGSNKADNRILSDSTQTGVKVGNILRVTIPTRFIRIWGNDYTATDDITNAFRITANNFMKINGQCNVVGGLAEQIFCNKNGAEVLGSTKFLTTTGYPQNLVLKGELKGTDYIDFNTIYADTIADINILIEL